MRKRINKALNIISYATLQTALVLSFSLAVYAEDIGVEAGGRWLLKEMGWVGLIIACGIGGKLLLARNFVAGVMILLIGGAIMFFTHNPDVFISIGSQVARIIGFGS